MSTEIGKVVESTSSYIFISINEDRVFEANKSNLQIGKYVQIEDGNHDFIICAIQSLKLQEDNKYIVQCQPIGSYVNNKFRSGTSRLPSPTEKAHLIDESIMSDIFVLVESLLYLLVA